MIALADSMSGQYASEKLLARHLLGRLKLEAREKGWKGNFLLDADWITDLDVVRQTPLGDVITRHEPILLVIIGPGHGDVTVDELRNFIRAKKRGKAA